MAGCAFLTPPPVRKGFPHLGWSLEFYGLLVAACPAVLASMANTGRGWTSGCRKSGCVELHVHLTACQSQKPAF